MLDPWPVLGVQRQDDHDRVKHHNVAGTRDDHFAAEPAVVNFCPVGGAHRSAAREGSVCEPGVVRLVQGMGGRGPSRERGHVRAFAAERFLIILGGGSAHSEFRLGLFGRLGSEIGLRIRHGGLVELAGSIRDRDAGLQRVTGT